MKRKTSNVSRISIVARSAWTKLKSAHAIDEDFDTWRRRICEEQFGCRLSQAPQSLHDDIEAHFLSLVGETGKAYTRLTGPNNAERRQRHAVKELASKLHISSPEEYANSLHSHQLKGVIINLKKRLKTQTEALSA